MSDYKVIESKVQSILESEVRLHLADGWEPVGSLSVSSEYFPGECDTRPTFRQALLHRTRDPYAEFAERLRSQPQGSTP